MLAGKYQKYHIIHSKCFIFTCVCIVIVEVQRLMRIAGIFTVSEKSVIVFGLPVMEGSGQESFNMIFFSSYLLNQRNS